MAIDKDLLNRLRRLVDALTEDHGTSGKRRAVSKRTALIAGGALAVLAAAVTVLSARR